MSNEKLEALKLGLLVPWDRQAIDTNRRIDAAHALGIAEGKREAADALAAHNAMLRPADIVAARIEGLREGAKIARENISWTGGYEGESVVLDEEDIVPVIDARIAELEANAPEVSETRAKAEAFDAALAMFKAIFNGEAPEYWDSGVGCIEHMEKALAEAKRKGAGT